MWLFHNIDKLYIELPENMLSGHFLLYIYPILNPLHFGHIGQPKLGSPCTVSEREGLCCCNPEPAGHDADTDVLRALPDPT